MNLFSSICYMCYLYWKFRVILERKKASPKVPEHAIFFIYSIDRLGYLILLVTWKNHSSNLALNLLPPTTTSDLLQREPWVIHYLIIYIVLLMITSLLFRYFIILISISSSKHRYCFSNLFTSFIYLIKFKGKTVN